MAFNSLSTKFGVPSPNPSLPTSDKYIPPQKQPPKEKSSPPKPTKISPPVDIYRPQYMQNQYNELIKKSKKGDNGIINNPILTINKLGLTACNIFNVSLFGITDMIRLAKRLIKWGILHNENRSNPSLPVKS